MLDTAGPDHQFCQFKHGLGLLQERTLNARRSEVAGGRFVDSVGGATTRYQGEPGAEEPALLGIDAHLCAFLRFRAPTLISVLFYFRCMLAHQ